MGNIVLRRRHRMRFEETPQGEAAGPRPETGGPRITQTSFDDEHPSSSSGYLQVMRNRSWGECLDNFEFSLNHLLDAGVLPDQMELDVIIERIGRKSQVAQRICAEICAYLTRTYEGVVASSAAYRCRNGCDDTKTETDQCIVFILLKQNELEINCQKYRTYERCYEISPESENENRSISEFERNESLPRDQLDKLILFVQSQTSSLLKQHSNLTMVSASWCKSRGSGTKTVILSRIPCISLYVPIKGLVPFDEDPFETVIGDYLVDVREGVFTPFRGANDYHQNLKMGCVIDGGGNKGTLGAFVVLAGDNNLFAITSAHVVLNHSQLKEVVEKRNVNYGKSGHEVFHPTQTPLNSFGQLVFATHSPGVNGTSGMEIAVIKMNPKRYPLDGSFPYAPNYSEKGFDQSNPFSFKSGKCCDVSYLHQSPLVVKYGSTTALTEGRVRVHGSTVRTGILAENLLDGSLILNNQIEIESLGKECFADRGDSGALVLTRTEEGLVAVGIFEGKYNDVYIVTPMKDILEYLRSQIGLCRLKSFDQFSCVSATDADTMGQNKGIDIYQRVDTSVNLVASATSNKHIEVLQSQISEQHMRMEHMLQRMVGLENELLKVHESVKRLENMIGSNLNYLHK